jgi:hypothetical protein
MGSSIHVGFVFGTVTAGECYVPRGWRWRCLRVFNANDSKIRIILIHITDARRGDYTVYLIAQQLAESQRWSVAALKVVSYRL